MGYTNSGLVGYKRLTNNRTPNRNHAIDTITIHCIVGQWTAKQGCDFFATTDRQASCNYVVGKDGSIGLSVEEKDRSWCSSDAANDHRAITIEVASGTTHPYAVTEKAYNALIELVADICRRNGKTRITWIPDKEKALAYQPKGDEMRMTVHRWFANKACPGDYLFNRHGEIAAKVNAKLGAAGQQSPQKEPETPAGTKITGTAVATVAQMRAYIRKCNKKVPQSVIDMIPLFVSEGAAEGIRGDIAFAQSCLETGNFAYSGSAVTLDQNNFCGMGVTQKGMKGNSFETPQLGIRAQIQHLKAYANKEALKNVCIDPRFKYVTRGCAPIVEYLGIQENPEGKGWAAGAKYGEKILKILKSILQTKADGGSQETGAETPFKVRVKVNSLNIRTDAGVDKPLTGKVTGKGIFTIVKTKQAKCDSKGTAGTWGLLKSYAEKENGWICLAFKEYTEKV